MRLTRPFSCPVGNRSVTPVTARGRHGLPGALLSSPGMGTLAGQPVVPAEAERVGLVLLVPVRGSAERGLEKQTAVRDGQPHFCSVGREGLFCKKHNCQTWFLLLSRGASSLLGLDHFSFF